MNKLKKHYHNTSQNKDEIYRAVIEQLMCNNAMYSLDKINTSSEQCKNTNPEPPKKEGKNIQNCIDDYEKNPDADKLRDCVDGLTDKTSTTDKKVPTNYYQKDINWTNGVNSNFFISYFINYFYVIME